MSETNISELIEKLSANVTIEKTKGIDTAIRLILTGDQGGIWNLVFKDGVCSLDPKGLVTPNLILESTAEDFTGIINGTVQPVSAFMSGKLKFTGDISAALKLADLFRNTE